MSSRRKFLKEAMLGTAAAGLLGRMPLGLLAQESQPTPASTVPNVLIIMSDEHSGSVMRCAGDSVVRTPNLDRLAAEGVLFSNCYTPSPLCAPGRASAFTGMHVHRLGTWDNGTPYDGQVLAMWDVLATRNIPMTIIGKTDLYPGEYENLSVIEGQYRERPDIGGLFRGEDIDTRAKMQRFHDMNPRTPEPSGDEKRVETTIKWLNDHANDTQPWVLQVGLLDPHFPWKYKPEYYEYYNNLIPDIPESAKAPYDELNDSQKMLQKYFQGEYPDKELIRASHVAYYSMVNELDDNIGTLLQALEQTGLNRNTIIIYCSDHGEQLGHHGLWWKCCMYEESARVPMIVKGPGLPQGQAVDKFVSLLDLPQTVYEIMQLKEPKGLDGQSLWPLAKHHDAPARPYVFSEYHAHGSPTGMFMVRWGDWKLVHYVDDQDQFFNLKSDPTEMDNLLLSRKEDSQVRQAQQEGMKILQSICDPKEVNERALAFQAKMRQHYKIEYSETPAKGIPTFHPEMDETATPPKA